MDHGSEWLLKLLSEQRHDLLELLDLKHKALVDAFKEHTAQEVSKDPQALLWEREKRVVEASCVVQPRLSGRQLRLGEDFSRSDHCKSPRLSSHDHCKSPRLSSHDHCKSPRLPSRQTQLSFKNETSVQSCATTVHGKKEILTAFFDLVDSDGNGTLQLDEVRGALQKVGQSPAQARRLVAEMEALCKGEDEELNGAITKEDWLRMVESQSDITEEIYEFAKKLKQLSVHDSRLEKERAFCCMLSVYSNYRLLWDILCSICVLYVVVFVPYWLAFEGEDVPEIIPPESRTLVGQIIDVIFLFDILLNFRTSYEEYGREERNWRKVALHYLRSWFLVDVASSIPLSFLDRDISGRGSIKLFKFVRFFTMLKVLRSAKAIHVLSRSAFGEVCEDFIIENKLQGKAKLLFVIFSLFFCCHWLACAMASCGRQYLHRGFDDDLTRGNVYVPTIYWALTTVSTVGYGDILPRNDLERLVAMLAMCMGGIMFALSTSIFTSIMLAQNKAELERASKMDIVNHWLHRHPFPFALKRRLRSYFKSVLNHERNNTREELDIFENLTSDLRSEVAQVLVPDEVREVPIFKCVPNTVMGFIVSILQMVSFLADEVVVRVGGCGDSMFIVMKGSCVKTTPKNLDDLDDVIVAKLFVGESFGEEIILGLADDYGYDVVAQERSNFYVIAESLFVRSMSTFPQHFESMRDYHRQSMEVGRMSSSMSMARHMSVSPRMSTSPRMISLVDRRDVGGDV